MVYTHVWHSGEPIKLPVGKAVCVGRNYAQHAAELNNPVPSSPLLFLKPSTSFAPLSPTFVIPNDRGECHHEIEIALLIGKTLSRCSNEDVMPAILGVGLALDLTMRDVQQELKAQGHPWEIAKSFDGALPISPFIELGAFEDVQALTFSLQVNGKIRQAGNAKDMLNAIVPLLRYMSQFFTLLPGDVVITGTPAGVASLQSGNTVLCPLNERYAFSSQVIA